MKKFIFKHGEKLDVLVDYIIKNKNNFEAILLDGELGAGKTTLIKQLAISLGEKKTIISPTFNSIIIYDNLVHIDAYKLKGSIFPYEDYFEDKLVAIEWSNNIVHNFKKVLLINVYLKDGMHIFEVGN